MRLSVADVSDSSRLIKMSDELPLNYQRMLRAQQPLSVVLKDALHERWHEAQASNRETAAKRLARASGLICVKCACGQEFPL